MGLIKIIKKSVTPLAEKVGHIFNSTNIENKEENTYSANIIDGLFKDFSPKEYKVSGYNSTYVNRGLKYFKVGKIVFCDFNNFKCNGATSSGGGDQIIFTGLPKPTFVMQFMAHTPSNTNNGVMLAINENGDITNWYCDIPLVKNAYYYGTFFYITKD